MGPLLLPLVESCLLKRGGKSKPPRLMPLPTVNEEKSKNLLVNIDSINAARNKLAEETAAKHGVKVELVLHRLMALSSSQHERKVNLFNAKTHNACKKARQG
jgi:formate-dependent nitrite reductase cytochrome c552 subunit